MAQFGTSIGIAIMAVISSSFSEADQESDQTPGEVLMQGYRAVFWACFALMLLTVPIGMWGLRAVKQIGSRKD